MLLNLCQMLIKPRLFRVRSRKRERRKKKRMLKSLKNQKINQLQSWLTRLNPVRKLNNNLGKSSQTLSCHNHYLTSSWSRNSKRMMTKTTMWTSSTHVRMWEPWITLLSQWIGSLWSSRLAGSCPHWPRLRQLWLVFRRLSYLSCSSTRIWSLKSSRIHSWI